MRLEGCKRARLAQPAILRDASHRPWGEGLFLSMWRGGGLRLRLQPALRIAMAGGFPDCPTGKSRLFCRGPLSFAWGCFRDFCPGPAVHRRRNARPGPDMPARRRGWPGIGGAEATPSLRRLCPAMTERDAESVISHRETPASVAAQPRPAHGSLPHAAQSEAVPITSARVVCRPQARWRPAASRMPRAGGEMTGRP